MIIDVNQSNIQEELVTKSAEKTILFYVYDPGNPQTQAVTSALESTVGQNNEFLTLAKGNAADPVIQSICMQLQISSLPSICVFKNGRPVDIIGSSALSTPDSASAVVAGLMPAKEQILLHEATALLAEENVNGAFAKISEAFGLAPNDINIRFAYVEIAIRAKKLTEARTALEGVDANNRLDKIYGDLEAALTLAEKNQQNPEIDILQNKLKQNPDDLDNVEKLCTALSQSGKATEALDLLLGYLRKDLNAGNLKQVYLDIISTMNGDPKQSRYRSKLYTIMY